MIPVNDFIINNLADNCQLGVQVSTSNSPYMCLLRSDLNLGFRLFKWLLVRKQICIKYLAITYLI